MQISYLGSSGLPICPGELFGLPSHLDYSDAMASACLTRFSGPMSTSKAWCMGVSLRREGGWRHVNRPINFKRDKRGVLNNSCQDTLLMRLPAAPGPQIVTGMQLSPFGDDRRSRHAILCSFMRGSSCKSRKLYPVRHSTQGIILFAHTDLTAMDF